MGVISGVAFATILAVVAGLTITASAPFQYSSGKPLPACSVKLGAPGVVARGFQSSGNRAFDEYREETLTRLEEEQREFRAFLDRLRKAKDKEEFDQFMADRRSRPAAGPQGDATPA